MYIYIYIYILHQFVNKILRLLILSSSLLKLLLHVFKLCFATGICAVCCCIIVVYLVLYIFKIADENLIFRHVRKIARSDR